MQINCTVFIQVINFWLTYLFLSKILLKPLIDMLNKKESAKKTLTAHLNEKTLFIQNLLNKKNQDLIEFRNQIQIKYQAPSIKLPEITTEFSYTHNQEHIEKLIISSKNLIIERVSNAL